MSSSRRHNPDPDAAAIDDVLAPAWQRLADDFPRLNKKAFKKRLRKLSRNDQARAWKAISEQDPNQFEASQAISTKLDADFKQIEIIAVGAWADDYRSVAPAALGEFPPGGKDTLMRKAAGERRLYPPQYLTTSGHSYDVFVQHVYLGRVQALLDDGDGYHGSVVSIYDLHPSVRAKYRRKANGKHGASNSINFDGIPD